MTANEKPEQDAMATRVVLADDHQIFREGLTVLLKDEPSVTVVGESGDGLATLELVKKLRPDVVIMDVTMPGLNGIEATREVLNIKPDIKVLALSMHAEGRFAAAMFEAGAAGYLPKHCASEELVDAIRAVAQGETYLSQQMAGTLASEFVTSRHHAGESSSGNLTPREREVLQLLAEGQNAKEVAASLSISYKTVCSHRERITQKLGMHSLAELTKYAIREGLTSVDN